MSKGGACFVFRVASSGWLVSPSYLTQHATRNTSFAIGHFSFVIEIGIRHIVFFASRRGLN